jgi:O-antigen ligase
VPLVGAAGLAFVVAFPFAAACLLLFLIGSIDLPVGAISAGPVDVRPYELLLGVLLFVAVVRPRRATWGGWAGAALAAFLGLLVLSSALAIVEGRVSPADLLPWARVFGVYVLFFVVIRLFPDRQSLLRLLTVGAVLGAVSGVVAALIAMGTPIGAALDFTSGFLTQTTIDGVRRVRLPGVALAYTLFWFVVVQIVQTRGTRKLLWSLTLAGMGVHLAVSQNRNMWIGLVVGGLLMLAIGGPQVRHRMVATIAALAIGIALIVSFGFNIEEGSRLEPIVERGTTLFDPEAVGQERSLTHRAEENDLALKAARDNLLFGIGPGTNFGQTFGESRTDGTIRIVNQNFVHNQYIYLLMIGGIPLLVAFVVFVASVLGTVIRRRRDPVVLSCAVGLFMVMVSGVVMISFSSFEMVGALALVAGVLTAWTRDDSVAGAPDNRLRP